MPADLQQYQYPRELLDQPIEDRMSYLEDIIIAHPRLTSMLNEIIRLLKQPETPKIVIVMGPSGVGMSTLMRLVRQHLLTETLPLLEQHTDRICVAALQLDAKGDEFDWQQHTKDILALLHEPMIDHKIEDSEHQFARRRSLDAKSSDLALQQALERCFVYRSLQVLLLDKAHRLGEKNKHPQLLEMATALRDLSEVTGTKQVLFGTYEQMKLARILRRISDHVEILHFSKYHINQSQDYSAFRNIVYSFEQHLPFPKQSNLVHEIDHLYIGSVGCVGNVRDWLHRAAYAALSDQQDTLQCSYLEKYRPGRAQLLSLAKEAHEGEQAIVQIDEPDNDPSQQSGQAQEDASKKKQEQRRPGERNPHRDKTWRGHANESKNGNS